MGRKKINIPWKEVNEYLEAGCSGAKIASALGISYDTLSRRCNEEHKADFAEYSRLKKENGDCKLRLAQYRLALEGNVPMLIFLGKNRLLQSNAPKDQHSENINHSRVVVYQVPDNNRTKKKYLNSETLKRML